MTDNQRWHEEHSSFVRNWEMAKALKVYIDAMSVSDLICMVADICHEKADHLAAGGLDASAKIWLAAARTLDSLPLEV